MESKPLVPKLRFPEFSGEWQKVKVEQFFAREENHEKATAFESDKILTVKLHANGVVRNERTGALTGGTNYFRRKAGQFIFSKIDLLNGAFGIVPDELDGFYSSTDVPAFTFSTENSPIFFVNWLRENYRSLGIERTGTSATLKRVAPSSFRALTTLAPSHVEQQKIAECLTSLDELIAAEGRKLEALRTYKKGLTQNLFPREGETTPRLRFPEFRDAGEWCESTVGEQAVLVSGFPFDGKEISEDSTGVPLMRGINITEGMIRHNLDIDRYFLGPTDKLEKYVLRESDLVIGMDGSKVGKNSALISKRDVGALLVQRVARLRTEDPIANVFMFQIINSPRFHSYVDRINTSSGIPHISAKQINDFQVNLPREAEQGKIADLLTSINTHITAQAKKLDTLKLHKQGLMQGLFPSLDEVVA